MADGLNKTNSQGFLQPEEKEFRTFYKRSVWWMGHRALLKKLGLGFLVVLNAVLFLFAGWAFLDAYAFSYDRENQAVAAMAVLGQKERRDFSLSQAAEPLNLGEVAVIPTGAGKYDFYSTIVNVNKDWYATFDYFFVTSAGRAETAAGFILPDETRPFVLFSHTAADNPGKVSLELQNVEWRRLDARVIDDFPVWLSERLGLVFSPPSFTRLSDGGAETARLSFEVTNSTAYGFYQPSFLAVLWRGGAVGGIIRLSAAKLESGETKQLTARWLSAIPAVSKIEIFPEINPFESGVYLPPKGKSSSDAREGLVND